MDLELPDHIVELGATARRAFADLGGVDLARRAETDPGERASAAHARALGAFDLEPLADADQALAAFVLCREAGRVALPYPVEATLCRVDGAALVLVDPADPLVDHGDLLDPMLAVDIGGDVSNAEVAGPALGSRLAPFAVPVELRTRDAATLDAVDAAATLAWALSSATVLGYVDASLELAVEHVRTRHQFGQRIGDFQAVQFQIADAVVAASGLAELALFTIWRVSELGAAARVDALAIRLHAADVARVAMRTAQQLHGASGVAEEYDVSVLSRRVQATLRSPASSDRILDVLAAEIRQDGFASLFPQGRDREVHVSLPPVQLGTRHGPFPAILDPELIRRYADTTNDPNPRYQDGTAVPAAFPVMLVFDAQTAGNSAIPREAFRVMRAGLHGEHDLVLHRALVPGEELATYSEAQCVRVTHAGSGVILRIEMRDASDQVVAEQWWQTFLVGVDFGESQGPEPPGHTFPEAARAQPVGQYKVHVDLDQPTRYGEVSGDWSTHHFDRAAAEAEGFPDVFLHGLCTMAMCGQAVVETVADGDPTRVRRLAVRFASPTMLDEDLVVDIFRADPFAFAFEAACAGATVIKHGRAELRD